MMNAIRHRLERVVTSSSQKWSVESADSLSTVKLVEKTKFERGSAVETFTFVVRGEITKLRQYEQAHLFSVDLCRHL